MTSKTTRSAGTLMFGGGTALAALALTLPDGLGKTMLVLATPAATLIMGKLWTFCVTQWDDLLTKWDLLLAQGDIEKQIKALSQNPNVNPEILQTARTALNDILAISLTHKVARIKAFTKRK